MKKCFLARHFEILDYVWELFGAGLRVYVDGKKLTFFADCLLQIICFLFKILNKA